MQDWGELAVALTDELDVLRARRRVSDDPAVHLATELVEAALTAVEVVTSGDRPECGFRRVLDQLRSATGTARFGLVAAGDQRRLAAHPRRRAKTTCPWANPAGDVPTKENVTCWCWA